MRRGESIGFKGHAKGLDEISRELKIATRRGGDRSLVTPNLVRRRPGAHWI
jgi:hypothetical protein